jgi:PAS domain-containing protein
MMPLNEQMARLKELSNELEYYEHKRQKVLDFMKKAPVICFMKDATTGQYQFISEAGAKSFGLKEQEIVGKADWELLPEEAAKLSLVHDIKLLKEKEEFAALEYRTYGDKSSLYLVSRFLIINGDTSIGGFAIEVPGTFRLEPVKKNNTAA